MSDRTALAQQSVINGVPDQIGVVAKVHLLEDAAPMGRDGLRAQMECGRNLGDGFTADDSLEQLELAIGEPLVGRLGVIFGEVDREKLRSGWSSTTSERTYPVLPDFVCNFPRPLTGAPNG